MRGNQRRLAGGLALSLLLLAACGDAPTLRPSGLAQGAPVSQAPSVAGAAPLGATPGLASGSDPVDLPGELEDASAIGNQPAIAFQGDASWQIQRPSSADHPTEAYASAPSYVPGETMRLAVSTDAPTYTVAIFRLGATVQAMGDSGPQPGVRQPPPIVDPATRMVRAPWRYTYSQRIPASWPSGVYLAKVSGTGGTQSYAPFVVRSARPSKFLFVSNALDYAAYNRWGGSSLYWTGVGDPAPGVHAALAVSLDRPFASQDGASQLFTMEAPFIAWLEGHGYDVTYTTDYDLSTHPADQPLPRAVLFSGHGEYWGAPLRDWLDRHVLRQGDLGLGLFAADTGYWQVHFADPAWSGPRTITLYKDARLDPVAQARCPGSLSSHANAFRGLPCGYTPRAGNRPEQALFGVQYGSVVPGYYPYWISPSAPAQLLRGTGLAPGASLGRIAGGEVDWVHHTLPSRLGDRLFAATMTRTRGGTAALAQAVVRQLRSGGRVFASGTFWWGWGLEPGFAASHGVPPGFTRLTANLLDFLAGR